jgi:DNA-binding transcriptional ArsR family regulator
VSRKRGERVPPERGWHWAENLFVDQYAAEVGINATGVYYVLCRSANEDGQSHRSVSNIAQLLGLHPDTVRKAIKTLQKHGLVKVKHRRSAGLNKTNIYTVLKFSSARRERVPDTSGNDHTGNGTRLEPENVPDTSGQEEDPVGVDPFEVDQGQGGEKIKELQKVSRTALERFWSEDSFAKVLEKGWREDPQRRDQITEAVLRETGLPPAARRDAERFVADRAERSKNGGQVVTAGQARG